MATWSTTVLAVSKIIPVKTGDDLAPFIEAAEFLVTDQCTASLYGDPQLELIHRWLSAHFYDTMRPRVAQEGIATGPRAMYEFVKTNLRLDNTKYGQQAMLLDTDGNLAALNNAMGKITKPLSPAGGGADAGWLGTAWEDQ